MAMRRKPALQGPPLIYGAYGKTGSLVTRAALDRSARVVITGADRGPASIVSLLRPAFAEFRQGSTLPLHCVNSFGRRPASSTPRRAIWMHVPSQGRLPFTQPAASAQCTEMRGSPQIRGLCPSE